MKFPFHDFEIIGASDDPYFLQFEKGGVFYDDVAYALADVIKNSDVNRIMLVDVGANIGLVSLYCASIASGHGKSLSIHAFEPAPEAFKYLETNLSNSPFSENFVIHNVGCGAQQEKLQLAQITGQSGSYIQKDSNGCHPDFHGQLHDVNIIALDDFKDIFLSDINDLLILKIDVEGFEDEVLLGADKIIKSNRVVVFIEFNPWVLSIINKIDPVKFLYFLLDRFDYIKVVDLNRTPGFTSKRLTRESINSLMESLPSNFSVCDFICANYPSDVFN